MKLRVLSLLLTAVLLLSLAACGKPAKTPDSSDSAPTATGSPLVGENDGTSYRNTYFGLAFTPSKGWDMYDDEQMMDRNLPFLSSGDDVDYAEAINQAQEFYVMYAVYGGNDNTIAVKVENTATMFETLPSAEEYRAIQVSQLEGIPSLTTELITVKVDGQDFLGLKVLWGEGETVQTDISVYMPKDNYMVILNFSSLDGDHTAEWASWFDLL